MLNNLINWVGRSHQTISILFMLITLVSTKCYGHTDDYIMGYTTSIIHELAPNETIEIHLDNKNLNLIVKHKDLDPVIKAKLLNRLNESSLFDHIEISSDHSSLPGTAPKGCPVKMHEKQSSLKILPPGAIYDSPIADPKWPKFSAGYQKHFKNIYGKKIFNLSFGENLSLLRYKQNQWQYELGVQAGLFGIMDIHSFPTKLINSDYFIGVGLSVNYDKAWQNLFQVSHLSSHLGDEFLISRPDYLNRRINLSYETLKWFTAYKINSFRPYIAFGYLVHRDPSYIKPFTLEAGVDFISEEAFLFNSTRFVGGLHTHFWSQNNFKSSLNVRTGLQLGSPVWRGRHLQFLIDYSVGKSRHGQFFNKNENYIGLMIAVSN
jgi:hypothetical protein